MICNHFADPLYAHLAAQELGLEVFALNDIMEVNFRHDIEVGDHFLQYRRAGYPGIYPKSYSDREKLRLPALIRDHGLVDRFIGAEPPRVNSPEAFRIFRVKAIDTKNKWRTRIIAESIYSTPQHWSFKSRRSRFSRRWQDLGYRTFMWRVPTEVRLTFCEDSERYRSHNGVIGKFDMKCLGNHLQGTTKEKSFYALFRALVSNEPMRPSVVKAVEQAKENVDLEEILP